MQDNLRRRNAVDDEWNTEVLHESAKELQATLLHWICTHDHDDPGNQGLDAVLAGDFAGPSVLRPAQLDKVFDDGFTRVFRAPSPLPQVSLGSQASQVPAREHMGTLAQGLLEPFGEQAVEAHFKIKTVDVHDEQSFSTSVLVFLDGTTVQQNAEWEQEWVQGQDGLRLSSLSVTSFEEVHALSNHLADRTRQVFEGFDRMEQEFLIGVEHYRGHVDRAIGEASQGMQGIAVGDVNGDGADDLYVSQHAGTPNRLFLHGDDGRALDVTEVWHAGVLDTTRSALLIDWDNDGDQDLVAALSGPGILAARNKGGEHFGEMAIFRTEEEGQIYSMSAADADGDGDLDIYCCRYGNGGVLHSIPIPYHDANNGVGNILFRNDDGVFVDATAEFGLDENNRKFSLASIWEDFDEDGDLDLYVANDYGRNNLYRNDGGHFTDIAQDAGCDDLAAGMGVSVSDVDADGDMDIYVTNMFSSAGLRIASQSDQFMGGENREVHDHYRRHARGNSLLKNRGDGTFEDVTVASGASVAGWSWGSQFLDLNNDGLEDIYAPNGFLTNADTGDL